ncbi:MAG: GGDEF domain-containing protein, partial [Caldilineaceae bacterium]|nr:GGDEF domain-containing protein [Caldilineaceae bacterium]
YKDLVAVLFIDLDDFKPVNDTFGHDIGDRVLQEVAQRLSASIRECDTVGRIGGDEFLVVLTDVAEVSDIHIVAERITEATSQPFDLAGAQFSLSVSVGVALFAEHGDDPEALIRAADQAMYCAKRSGGNGYVLAYSNIDTKDAENELATPAVDGR